jgi:hypothetical protein
MISNDDALEAMASLRTPGDAVFSLSRVKLRNPLLSFLDVVVSGGALTSAADVADTASVSVFLVDSQHKATIVQLQDGRVTDTIDVPDWTPERSTAYRTQRLSFKGLVVDGYRYSKVMTLA